MAKVLVLTDADYLRLLFALDDAIAYREPEGECSWCNYDTLCEDHARDIGLQEQYGVLGMRVRGAYPVPAEEKETPDVP